EANPNELNQDDARYGFRCCHLKNIWTAPLPPETELSRQMTTSTTSIDIMGLQAAYANLHTDQELVLPQLDINNTIDHRPEGDEKWFLENEKTVTQFCRKLAAERPLKDIR